jgi:DNA-binding transcriptional LysR family regulator
MELHQVRYFAALCKTLNFTRAAEACYVGQSALTRAIQRLEEELGGPLFQRERNLTQLTGLGRLVRPLLEQTLAMAEAAKEHAVEFAKGERASLRLGLPPTIFADVAGRILADVMARLPALEVEIFADTQPRTIEKLLQGEVDVAFLIDPGDLPPRLNRWQLYKESFRIVVAPAHPLATLEAVSTKMLAGEPTVERRDCRMAIKLREFCARMDAPLGARHWVETEEHLQHLAARSLGIGLLPERTPVMPPLVTRTICDLDLTRSVTVAVVSGRRFTPAIDFFIRIARARNFAVETDGVEPVAPKGLSPRAASALTRSRDGAPSPGLQREPEAGWAAAARAKVQLPSQPKDP